MEKTPEQRLYEINMEEGQASGRKLKFHEQCAAFALLYGRTKPRIVARAFAVSGATVSHLAGCLEQDPDPTRRRLVFSRAGVEEKVDFRDHNQGRAMNRALHYEKVAREFEALGVTEFNRRYLTDDIINRVDQARAQLRSEKSDSPTALNTPLTREERLARMSMKEINAYYAEHPDQDPRNQESQS